MCINPIQIPNVNYGKKHIGTLFTKDTENRYMFVPCGHCPDCVAAAQAQFVQRAEVESRYNHVFFATLTYNQKYLPSLTVYVPKKNLEELEEARRTKLMDETPEEYAERQMARESELIAQFECGSPNGDFTELSNDSDVIEDPLNPNEAFCEDGVKPVNFTYADIRDVQLMIKNIRDNVDFEGRSMKYVAVSELGKTNGRPHFHILFFVQKKKSDFLPTGDVNPAVTSRIEKKLYKACFKFWARNVGTRKNPVYEPLFTYARKFYGNKCYTNFDLHYVDPKGRATLLSKPNPELAKKGTSPVIYYVSKYLMKGSEKEVKRQQFLRLNLDDEQYKAAWSVIKCRMTVSKGFGLNATFSTEDVPCYIPLRADFDIDLAKRVDMYNAYVTTCDDLPVSFAEFCRTYHGTVRRRVMHPDKELMASLKKDALRDVGKTPGPIFVNYEGKHVPLAHYYQKHSEIYDQMDLMTCWFMYNPLDDVDRKDLPQEELQKIVDNHNKRLKSMMANSTFDTSPALLFPGEGGNTHQTISL